MINKIISFVLLTLISYIFFNPPYVSATTYDLIAPSGPFTRGQEVQFTINIDTEGKTIYNAQIGMTYDTSVLQYVSTNPGNTFSQIETDSSTAGQLIFSASDPNGYSGSGVFAYVTFKIIADSPGSTRLCILFNPENPPTSPSPSTFPPTSPSTSPPTSPSTFPPTSPSTSPPPTSGAINQTILWSSLGLIFLLGAGIIFFRPI